MESQSAVKALAALAHESRLAIFRLLVRQGPDGTPAGEIAQALALPPATLSFHIAHLERAGLVTSRREGRSIRYTAAYDDLRDLIQFLIEDCCQGHPQVTGANPCNDATTQPCCSQGAPS